MSATYGTSTWQTAKFLVAKSERDFNNVKKRQNKERGCVKVVSLHGCMRQDLFVMAS
jgi:hypothetical protein